MIALGWLGWTLVIIGGLVGLVILAAILLAVYIVHDLRDDFWEDL